MVISIFDATSSSKVTDLTKAMILGGLLSLVWKRRLLMTLYGLTRACNVGLSIVKGRPSMYKFVEAVSLSRSMRALKESGGSVAVTGRATLLA